MIKHIASIHRFQNEKTTGGGGGGEGKSKGREEFSCGFCGELYQVKVNLMKHIKELHSEKLLEVA